MLFSRNLIILLHIQFCYGQVSVLRKNFPLSRKRRYLLFPEGSNFVMTMSYVKAVMVEAPKMVNVLGECDVPFKLPSDPQLIGTKKLHHRMHYRQRRKILSQMEEALSEQGINGNACVKRMICDAQRFIPARGKSLVGDMLSSVFTFTVDEPLEDDVRFKDYCSNTVYEDCKIPFLTYVMGSLMK